MSPTIVAAPEMLPPESWRPADGPAAGVERVEVAVVGADVDGRAEAGDVRDGRPAVDVVAGGLAPGEAAVARGEGIDLAVGVADVHAAERDRGRGVEDAARAEARAVGLLLPDEPAVVGVHGRDLAGLVAEEQPAVGVRDAVDRARGLEGPLPGAVLRLQRVDRAVLGAEVDDAVDHHRRGLAPAREVLLPERAPVLGAQGDDPLRGEQRHEQPVLRVGGRGGVELREVPPPLEATGLGGEGLGRPAVAHLVERALREHRRVLEKPLSAHRPGPPEGRLDVGVDVARAPVRVAVGRPDEGLRLLLGGRLLGVAGVELDVGVRDVPLGLVDLEVAVQAGAHREGGEHAKDQPGARAAEALHSGRR